MMNLRCLFFILGTFLMNAQYKKEFFVELNKVYEPSIEGNIYMGPNIYNDQSLIPKFKFQEQKLNSGAIQSYKIKVLKSKVISKIELENIELENLPTRVDEKFRLIKEGEKEFLSLEINPLYLNRQKELIKIESFELTYVLSTSSKKISKINKKSSISNSVLSSGKWYKIAIDKTGVFKMDTPFLNSLGINTSSIDPRKIRVFGNGGAILPEILSTARPDDLLENAIEVFGEEDGRFDGEDYVLFYGRGPISWEINKREFITHKQNIYSDKAYYFINVDSGINGKRIQTKSNITSLTTEVVKTFTDFKVHEKELVNYLSVGKRWFGEDFALNNTQNFRFNFSNIVNTTKVLVKAACAANSNNRTSYNLSYAGSEFMRIFINRSNSNSYETSKGSSFISPKSELIDLNVSWNENLDPSAQANLDYIEVVADRFLVANGNQFGFLNFSSKKNDQVLEYLISNDFNIDEVWEVTNFTNIKRITDQDNTSTNFKFKEVTDGVLNRYQIVNLSNTYTPIKPEGSFIVENQNLHGLNNVQYLIVTTKEFVSDAERLAKYHRENTRISDINSSFLNVKVVDLEKIYNEFGSGAPDITAIRDFVKFLYDKNATNDLKLKYLCLFGDASFDYKGILHPGSSIVPVYLSAEGKNLRSSYNSDDYYAYLDTTDDVTEDGNLSSSGKLEIATGRVPVRNKKQAEDFVNKTLNYYSSNSFGDWKNKITLLGDDGKAGKTEDLILHLDNSAQKIELNNPNFNLEKLYTDAFDEVVTAGGGRYPEIKKRFIDAFNKGSLVISYFGHGGIYSLGEENYLDISDIRSLKNKNNLPLFITVTCDFSKFDNPLNISGGEELITSPTGGTGSMITTTREIYIENGRKVNNLLANYLFDLESEKRSVAESLKVVKNDNTLTSFQKAFIFFFGDPAMKLYNPKKDVVLKKIQKEIIQKREAKKDIIVYEDVNELNLLSTLKFTGQVDNNGVLDSSFNGDLSISLYGKPITRTTKLNEGSGTPVSFKSLESKIFTTKASVTNGKFDFKFVLPKDLSSNTGEVKFSFYAFSKETEKGGSNFKFKIGEIDETVEKDVKAPEIQLFMEDKSFVNGGIVTSEPLLIAEIQDENGINTSMSGIGHNITVVIDGDSTNPISLNNYYSTVDNNFRKGAVSFKLPELSPGLHSIKFKAWDTHNNSASKTLEFEVEDSSKFEIVRVLNYPNPFISYTQFWFEHNRKGKNLDVMVQVYTVSGKLVKRIYKKIISADRKQRSLNWDGNDDYGNKLGKGTYVYKLTVKEISSGETVRKIDKLVIL